MPDTKPLAFIASSLILNSAQEEEFTRLSELFNRAYNCLLTKWYVHGAKRAPGNLRESDYDFIEHAFEDVRRREWLRDPDERQIAQFASQELARNLREREHKGVPLPSVTAPMTKLNDEVVFYWKYDVKVKDRTVRVPVLGKANTGRFKYFTGSIRAIGVRRDPILGMQCVIYHRENVDSPAKAAAGPWTLGSDPIPQSPLNQELRKHQVGFML